MIRLIDNQILFETRDLKYHNFAAIFTSVFSCQESKLCLTFSCFFFLKGSLNIYGIFFDWHSFLRKNIFSSFVFPLGGCSLNILL